MSIRSAPSMPVLLLALLLAACASAPPPPSVAAALTDASPQAMVAAIRAAGEGKDELAVQPLRDARVDDLRQQAAGHEARREYAEAAQALDAAIAIVPDDPELLQERAEASLLAGDHAAAAELAEHAFGLGSQVGPLCRRHWKTIEQARLHAGDAGGAHAAGRRVAECTVASPNRF